jgi:hypothetical protein
MIRQPLASSSLASVGFDPESRVLEVQFKNGGLYQYLGVAAREFSGLLSAESHGHYFAQHIRRRYRFRRLG